MKEALVQHTLLCLWVQWQPVKLIYLLTSAIALFLDVDFDKRRMPKCRAGFNDAAWCNHIA